MPKYTLDVPPRFSVPTVPAALYLHESGDSVQVVLQGPPGNFDEVLLSFQSDGTVYFPRPISDWVQFLGFQLTGDKRLRIADKEAR